VFLLTGDDDTIAPPEQATTLSDQLTSAPAREVWMARTDLRGLPIVSADHAAPLSGRAPSSAWRATGRGIGGVPPAEAARLPAPETRCPRSYAA
jgi:hypothetical protein